MTLLLKSFGERVRVEADDTSLKVSSLEPIDWVRSETWPAETLRSAIGRRTAMEVSTLLEMGLADPEGDAVSIPYGNFPVVREEEIRLPTAFTQPSPYLLSIDRKSDIGRPDFLYNYRFLLGGKSVPLARLGYYVTRAATGEMWHLDDAMFAIVDAMDRFNALSPTEKDAQTSWLTFANVKELSREVNATLDQTLETNDVIVPSSIGLDFYEEADGAFSFIPTSPDLDDDAFRTVFQRNDNAEGFYSLDQPNMGRLRVVLTARHRAVLERMKRVQRVHGLLKEQIKANPAAVFDGIVGDVEIPYSDRVVGIGRFEYVPVPRPEREEGGFSDLLDGGRGEPSERVPKEVGAEKPSKYALLISTHEDEIRQEYLIEAENARTASCSRPFERPLALRPETDLKRHQEEGIQWLQTCASIDDRLGVLLADDMGLGKTLQILSFLAWAIESGRFPDLSRPDPPYRPILIVAPLILLETGTWENEINRFFQNQGSVFGPPLSLFGPGLRSFRRREIQGREELIAQPSLDIDRIRKYKVVITTYEAVRDYEFSFAFCPEGKSLWSIVITDEAQEYKTPNSKISHAMKAIRPDFRVACTGTPVENRLLDLWNLFDAIQPGLLGTEREFVLRYETRSEADLRQATFAELKERLLYRRPEAFLLRRSKADVLDLPRKHERRIACAMSQLELECHRRLKEQMPGTTHTSGKLDLLQRFARLYQHPVLLQDADGCSEEELLAQSTKLSQLIELLREIRNKNEKTIIFCRHKDMQRVLVRVISAKLHRTVRVINGDTPRAGSSRNLGVETRNSILNEFQKRDGFDVLILSPFVAGVGLTIVEANHVIHYGRWWNPAVEAQATDRAYRIGQKREVTVYYLINEDPTGAIKGTFDQLLDDLMRTKQELADQALGDKGFLVPQEDEQAVGMEVYDRLLDLAESCSR